MPGDVVPTAATLSPTPIACSALTACGLTLTAAPISPRAGAVSNTSARIPWVLSACAAASPASPPPTIAIPQLDDIRPSRSFAGTGIGAYQNPAHRISTGSRMTWRDRPRQRHALQDRVRMRLVGATLDRTDSDPGKLAPRESFMEDMPSLAESILEQIADAVIYADRSGTIRRWN